MAMPNNNKNDLRFDKSGSSISALNGNNNTFSSSFVNLKFQDLISPYSISEIKNSLSFTNVAQTTKCIENFVNYEIIPDVDILHHQSVYFTKTLVANQPMYTGLTKLISCRTFEDAIVDVQNAYKYSYFKALMEIKFMYDTGFNNTAIIRGNSYLFGGHKIMFNTLARKVLTTFDPVNQVTTIRRINLYFENIVELLIEDPLFSKIYDPDSTEFYNPRMEMIIKALSKGYPDMFILDLSSQDSDLECISPEDNPLGSSCFDSDLTNICYIGSSQSHEDEFSKFLNLACFVSLSSEFIMTDSNSSIYRKISVENMDPNVIKFMVRSVTGLEIFGNMINLKSITVSANLSGDSVHSYEVDPVKPRGGGDGKETKYSKVQKRKGKQGKKNNIIDKIRSIFDSTIESSTKVITSEIAQKLAYMFILNNYKNRNISNSNILDIFDAIMAVAEEKQLTIESKDTKADAQIFGSGLGISESKKTVKVDPKNKGFNWPFMKKDKSDGSGE